MGSIAIIESEPASYPHTSGDYNLMISGGENGSQEGGSTGPSVHEGIQDRSGTTGAECWLLRSQPKAQNSGAELTTQQILLLIP
jgi:hypothetical protein